MHIGGALTGGLGSVGHQVGHFVPWHVVELAGLGFVGLVVAVVLGVYRRLRRGPVGR